MTATTRTTTRTATVADIVKRLTDTVYPLTAEDGLGWGLGPAQLRIDDAVNAAVAAGLVERVTLRGKPMLRLAPQPHRLT